MAPPLGSSKASPGEEDKALPGFYVVLDVDGLQDGCQLLG